MPSLSVAQKGHMVRARSAGLRRIPATIRIWGEGVKGRETCPISHRSIVSSTHHNENEVPTDLLVIYRSQLIPRASAGRSLSERTHRSSTSSGHKSV